MAASSDGSPPAWLGLDPTSGRPLYEDVCDSVRRAILAGQLRPGDRLPPSRRLAAALGVSRTTTLTAYEQLRAEGYIEAATGSGTFVSRVLPDLALRAEEGREHGAGVARRLRASDRARVLMERAPEADRGGRPLRALLPGVPALRDFPHEQWNRILSREARALGPDDHGYGDPAGLRRLREQVAHHVRSTRALRCEARQVIVVSGSQQALGLIAQVLADPGDPAWMEDPGYVGARIPFELSPLKLVPVPVDREGLDVERGLRLHGEPRLVFVSPSHQVPLGVTMSLKRRLQLLELAREIGCWIVEDDYDSEFRYAGRPLSSLQGIDRNDRVIYLGSFSKALHPALRLGYMVVPHSLVDLFRAAKSVWDAGCPTVTQAAAAAFMEDGLFTRHVRRMRVLYRDRQRLLREAVAARANDVLRIEPSDSGIHVVAWLPVGVDDRAVSARAEQAGVETIPLSVYCLAARLEPGLVLGYAPFEADELAAAAGTLRDCILAET